MKVAMKITESRGTTDSTTIRELGNPGMEIMASDYLSPEFAEKLETRLDESWNGRRIKKVIINVILED